MVERIVFISICSRAGCMQDVSFGIMDPPRMSKNRLEAFSDGVIAIIITIMVLEMKPPHSDSLAALKPVIPVFFSYILSFIYIAIYWNNHHHMLSPVQHVNGLILCANLP